MHRLFVAIRPPSIIRDALIDVMEGVPDLRWQSDEQLHLTLRFVGEVERPLAEDIASALARVRVKGFALALAGIGEFEQHRRGALWAGVTPHERVRAVAAKIEWACQAAGVEPEHRVFHPHITLARWSGRKSRLDGFLQAHGRLSSRPWQVGEFVLFESRLGRDGAQYDAVATYPFD